MGPGRERPAVARVPMTSTTVADSQALCTGWEPDLPQDTLLRRFLLHLSEHLASAATGAVVRAGQ